MDITKEPEKLKNLIAQCDTVVNLAAICNPSEYIKQPVNTIRSNYNDAQVSHDAATATRTHALPCPPGGAGGGSRLTAGTSGRCTGRACVGRSVRGRGVQRSGQAGAAERLPVVRRQDCIEFCVEHKKHLIHFSTCEVYGRTLASYGLPQDDPKNYILDEDTTPMIMGPVSAQRWCYACAKQLVERLIYAHGTENNLKFTIVRPYNWIGPRMDYIPGVDGKDDGQPRVLASFMTALMKGEPLVLVNGGEVYRTFCFVDDAVDAVCRIIDHPDKSQGQTFNVGNPNNNIQVRLRFIPRREGAAVLCGWLACNAVTCMQPHALLTLLLRDAACTQIRKLAELMIELYSNLTGKPKGTTRTVDGAEYYGKGYEDSDLRIPSMRLVKQQLDWEPKTTLKEAMEMTMKVCVVGALSRSHLLSSLFRLVPSSTPHLPSLFASPSSHTLAYLTHALPPPTHHHIRRCSSRSMRTS